MIATPKYVVDLNQFNANCIDIMTPFNTDWNGNVAFGYSVKTNRDPRLIKYANEILKWYVEVVSPDEFDYCKSLGIKEEQMILNGPCKVSLIGKMDNPPYIINLDNQDEIERFVSFYPNYTGLVGIRVNFDLEKRCPGETTAGEEVSRFGIDSNSEEFKYCISNLLSHGIKHIGLHLHTSTKTRSCKVFAELAKEAVRIYESNSVEISFIDIGGGFFGGQNVAGKPTMIEYSKSICDVLNEKFDNQKTKLILEPGESVISTCVRYETMVINKRSIRGESILTVDGSLLHINPFMVKRNQPFELITSDFEKREIENKQIVGGATCMENDRLAVVFDAPKMDKGDILSFKFVGAYTMGFNSKFILNPPNVEYIERN